MSKLSTPVQQRKKTTPLSVNKKNCQALVIRAVDLSVAGEFTMAKQVYEQALSMDSNSFEAINGLGFVLLRLENHQEAMRYLKRASEMEPDDTVVLTNLAEVYISLEKPDEAIRCCERIQQIDPSIVDTSSSIYNILSDAYHLKRDFERTRHYCMKALQTKSDDNYIALGKMGEVYHALKMYDRALEFYGWALKQVPNDFIENYNIAMLYIDMKEYARAIEHLKVVLRERPDYLEAVTNLASVYETIGEEKLAIQTYGNYLKVHPLSAPGRCGLAQLHLNAKNYKEALKQARKATECDTKCADAWNILGECLLEEGKYAKACEAFTRVKRWKPDFVFRKMTEQEVIRLLGEDHPMIQEHRRNNMNNSSNNDNDDNIYDDNNHANHTNHNNKTHNDDSGDAMLLI